MLLYHLWGHDIHPPKEQVPLEVTHGISLRICDLQNILLTSPKKRIQDSPNNNHCEENREKTGEKKKEGILVAGLIDHYVTCTN